MPLVPSAEEEKYDNTILPVIIFAVKFCKNSKKETAAAPEGTAAVSLNCARELPEGRCLSANSESVP